MEKKNPIEEARRYVDNAKDLLREKGELDPETHSYSDRKYVKMAGNFIFQWATTVFSIKKFATKVSVSPVKSLTVVQ